MPEYEDLLAAAQDTPLLELYDKVASHSFTRGVDDKVLRERIVKLLQDVEAVEK